VEIQKVIVDYLSEVILSLCDAFQE